MEGPELPKGSDIMVREGDCWFAYGSMHKTLGTWHVLKNVKPSLWGQKILRQGRVSQVAQW